MPKLNETYVSEYSKNTININNVADEPDNYVKFITTSAKERHIAQITLSKKNAVSLARNILDYYTEILLKDLK